MIHDLLGDSSSVWKVDPQLHAWVERLHDCTVSCNHDEEPSSSQRSHQCSLLFVSGPTSLDTNGDVKQTDHQPVAVMFAFEH